MKKFEKLLKENATLKDDTLAILKILENYTYASALDVLDCARYFCKLNRLDYKQIENEIIDITAGD